MAATARGSWHLLLSLVGLVVLALLAQSVVAAHLDAVRGREACFPAPVAEADVPLLGVNVTLEQYESAALDEALARIAGGGFVWLRQPFAWHQIEVAAGRYDWTTPDRFLAALDGYPQLRLVAVLDDDPPNPPDDPDRFARFAAAFAARYGERVDYYQIWDEPNLAERWGGGPVSPVAYADLLARTAQAIRAADPGARILLAGLAPTTELGSQNLSDVRYLDRLYRAGAAPYFDIVTGKPYGFYTGPDDRRVDESVLNFSRLLLLREVMVAQGDEGKAVWASHWGWNALPAGWAGAPSVWGLTDAASQAARTVAALERARAEWPWCGALILEHYQPAVPLNDAHWGFALIGPDGAPRPVYDALAVWAADRADAAPPGGYAATTAWATYEGQWRVGPLGADTGAGDQSTSHRATFRFDGPSVALTVRRGPYRAFLYVTVDGRPASALPRDSAGRAYVVLYDETPGLVTVPLARGLGAGPHIVEVVAEGGQGQWALVDWRVGAAPLRDGFGWKVAGLAAVAGVLLVFLVRDLQGLRRWVPGWPQWVQIALAVGMTGVLWVAAGISWGRDWVSPWLVVSLLCLPALAMLFARRPDLGLALIALTVPFYLVPDGLAYRALGLPQVLVLLCALGMVAGRRVVLRGVGVSGIDLCVMALILAAAVASVAARDRRLALFELGVVFFLPALAYGLLRRAGLDEAGRWCVVDGLALGGVALSIVGLVLYAAGRNVVLAEGGLPRLRAFYASPNNVGLYLDRIWPLLVAVALWGRGRRRMLYALALVPVALTLAFSFSRGALLLGVPAALLVMGWRAGGRYRWAALALVALGGLGMLPLMQVPRFASLLNFEQGSAFVRLELWRSTVAVIRDHPWFGVGPGNFLAAYRTRYVLPAAWQEFDLEHPHNVYLDHWVRLGGAGVLAGLATQVAFWWTTLRSSRRDALALGLAGCMATFLAHGLVDNTLFFPDLALTFGLMLALAQPVCRPTSRELDQV